MKSARRRAREFALQAVYQWQLADHTLSDIQQQYVQADGFAKADSALFVSILSGVLKHSEVLIAKLQPHLDRPRWIRARQLVTPLSENDFDETPTKVASILDVQP